MDPQRRLTLLGLASCSALAAFPCLSLDTSPLLFPFGQLPTGTRINKVVSAGAPSDLLLLALVPEKLVGFAAFQLQEYPWFDNSLRQLTKLGRLAGRASTLSLEQLLLLQPDLIVDCGDVNDTFRSVAERTAKQTGIPYLLISGRLVDSAQQLLQAGRVLGVEDRAKQLATIAQQYVDEARQFAKEQGHRLSFYAARSANGLETGLQGSLHTEAIELLGLRNVATVGGRKGLAQVSMEQLLLWQPDVIITQDETCFQHIRSSPLWQGIKAVQQGNVWCYRQFPFGWLDSPPGLNRLLGLRRLQYQLQPERQAGLQAEVQQFFQLFFHSTLTDEHYRRLVATDETL